MNLSNPPAPVKDFPPGSFPVQLPPAVAEYLAEQAFTLFKTMAKKYSWLSWLAVLGGAYTWYCQQQGQTSGAMGVGTASVVALLTNIHVALQHAGLDWRSLFSESRRTKLMTFVEHSDVVHQVLPVIPGNLATLTRNFLAMNTTQPTPTGSEAVSPATPSPAAAPQQPGDILKQIVAEPIPTTAVSVAPSTVSTVIPKASGAPASPPAQSSPVPAATPPPVPAHHLKTSPFATPGEPNAPVGTAPKPEQTLGEKHGFDVGDSLLATPTDSLDLANLGKGIPGKVVALARDFVILHDFNNDQHALKIADYRFWRLV